MARPATGFVSQPEPRTIGSFAKGRQLTAGNFLFAGFLIEARNTGMWDLPMPDAEFEKELHGFTWLDDLAAVGDASARQRAQSWTWDWIAQYGRGKGMGWTPDLTGRRLIRWINHALFLLSGRDRAASDQYFRSLAQQTIYLSRTWQATAPGLPRFEALTGLVYAGLSLTGMEEHVDPAIKALARESKREIDAEGGVSTRNPEELLEIFQLLTWASTALSEAGRVADKEHLAAVERMAPTLRALRHSDGGLARFHGGGRGLEGRLDHALASSGIRTVSDRGLAMGFARMHGGRTSVIIDASKPPQGESSFNAHASTFAFELTSGRRPLIVNCGSGMSFGPNWRSAGRATPSHSTMGVEGYSSSRLGAQGYVGGQECDLLAEGPQHVKIRQSGDMQGMTFHGGHDGYLRTHGLTHVRKLDLSADGRGLAGDDTLTTIEADDNRVFDRFMDRNAMQGVPFQIRFHLHPEVDAEVDMGGTAVSMALRSGEIWVFRHDGTAKLSLEPSVYLEKYRLKPRATKQVVLSGRVLEYASRICWTLAKAQDTPSNIRDLEPKDSPSF
nr:heparinase II/III family protein [Cochlodiniinecator piscidefendens]